MRKSNSSKKGSSKKRSSFISAIRANKYHKVHVSSQNPVHTKNYSDKRIAHNAQGFSGIRSEEQVQNLMAHLVSHLQKGIKHFDKRKQKISVENQNSNSFVLVFKNNGKLHELFVNFRNIPNRVVFRKCNLFIGAHA